MKKTIYKFVPVILIMFSFSFIHAQLPEDCNGHSHDQEIFLWPEKAPGSENISIEETIINRSNDSTTFDRIIKNIANPSMMVLFPNEPSAGKAVLICPGGGYEYVSYDKEGVDIACWFNSLGYIAFILKYRLPAEGHKNGRNVPLQDAQRAIRIIRAHAEEWNIDKNNIGVIGFSAGGHLASTLGTCYDKCVYTPCDYVDSTSARPDFMILLYPVISMDSAITHTGSRDKLLGTSNNESTLKNYSTDLLVTASTPPAFIVHAKDDDCVVMENSQRFYRAMLKAGIPAEIHIFEQGGHGFGIRDAKGPVSQWTSLCERWLVQEGL